MKKLLYSMFALAITAMTFISCEDVPAPYNDPNNNKPDDPAVVSDPTGTGTATDPFNIAAANKYVEDGGDESAIVYVKGIISSIKEIDAENYGNASYYISDDGTTANQFYVYRGYGLSNKKFTNEEDIKVGDAVVIAGKLINYNGTYEFAQGNYIVQLNGAGDVPSGETGTPKGTGTKDDPYNPAGVIAYINTLGSDVESPQDVYIKGKITRFDTKDGNYGDNTFGNASYYIAEEGAEASEFYVFRALYLGNKKYTSGTKPKEGDEVVVCGRVVNFRGNTPETAVNKAYLYSLNGETEATETPGPEPTGKSIEAGKYLFVFTGNSKVEVGKPIEASKDYGYMYLTDAQLNNDGTLAENADNLFTFTAADGGFTIQDATGRYYYMDDSHSSFQVSATKPTSNQIWAVTVADNGETTVKNVGTGKVIQYIKKYTEFTPTASGDGLPMLKKPGDKVSAGSGGGESTGGGEATGNGIKVTMASFGLANAAEMGTQTLSDGTKLVFDGGGNNNTPKYYDVDKSARMYPSNTMTITASKKVKKVVLTCAENNGTNCVAEGNVTANDTKATTSELTVTADNINNTNVVIKNTHTGKGAISQLRIVTMEITYAD